IYKSSPTDMLPLEGSFSILNLIQGSTGLNQGLVHVLFIYNYIKKRETIDAFLNHMFCAHPNLFFKEAE
ncbi:MAG: hypothetical protein QF649_02465, partial [SAR324 cluster bacterium]|nr:hypothetical protein [SAR324 cluster bacterium]